MADIDFNSTTSADYQQVARAIEFIAQNRLQQPDLTAIAQHVGLSKYHLQRLFVRWAGVSPKQFLSHLTLQHAKQLLRDARPVLDAALESGLSGSGRLHDLFVNVEAMTPGEYQRRGAELLIEYGLHPTPFGEALVMTTTRGICWLQFLDQPPAHDLLAEARGEWPLGEMRPNQAATGLALAQMLGGEPGAQLLLKGNRFQLKVWQALLSIPAGALCSYGALADVIGRPRAARAVGTAIGRNPVAWLVPCHRVLRQSGHFDGYRWGGATRKRAMVAWESSQRVAEKNEPTAS